MSLKYCQEGQEEIEVLVHAAANVHKLKSADGKPRTFVSIKVKLISNKTCLNNKLFDINPSIPSARNWRILAFEKRLRETERK